MKTIGYTNPRWSLKVAVQKQIEIEDAIAWSKRNEAISQYVHKPSKFKVTNTIKQAFASSFEFISSIPRL